ncbi:protein ripply2 [Synchiropus picturatus]
METFTNTTGLLSSVFTGELEARRPSLWRPWVGDDGHALRRKSEQMRHEPSGAKHPKAPQVVHPVKLFWPKSKCFDYLYQDAEMLLRNYPVQATICPYQDSSSDEDSDEEDEEMMEKELN